MATRPKIEACLFDMDGLLLDSERVYTEVCSLILKPYGKEFTWEVKRQMMGRPAPLACDLMAKAYDLPLTAEEIVQQMDQYQGELFATVKPMPGALRLVQHLAKHNVPIAIATSSKSKNYALKTAHNTELFQHFPLASIVKGDDPRVKRGKPNPDIFQLAATTLSFDTPGKQSKCLVFEDGIPGLQAGRSAGMSTVFVPDPNLVASLDDEQRAEVQTSADQQLTSLEEFKPEEWGLPAFD